MSKKKKKKKSYRTYPLPQKAPSCIVQSHPAPQPQATSDQLSVADLFCHFQNSTKMKLYSTHLCFSSLSSVPYLETHQVVVLLNFFGSFFAVVKYGYTPVCLLLMSFPVWGFMSTTAVKICAQAMSGHMLSFLLSKYLEM